MTGWVTLFPEIFVSLMIGVVLLLDLVLKNKSKHMVPVMVLVTGMLTLGLLWTNPFGSFGDSFVFDPLSRLIKTIIVCALLFVVLSSWNFEAYWKRPFGEYLVLLLSSTLGMMVLASSNELIILYVGLELATFPLVLLTAYRPQDKRSAEGGLKYLLLAAIGSAFLLFGLSLIYAIAGTTVIPALAHTLSDQGMSPIIVLGVIMVVAGIGFKLALVPFHMWAPDTYEGAPTPITAFLSIASKTAGFALALRLLAGAAPSVKPEWGLALSVLAAASMTLGNFAAIPQTNIKRLLAYSSIAQAGYMVMGLIAFDMLGLSSLLYYLIAYLFTNMAAFAVVIVIEKETGSVSIDAFKGLAQRAPRLALIMLLALLSLAGIPPLAGFTAKFYLFAGVFGQGHYWLVIVAVLNSAVSLYYYLTVIRKMYMVEPPTELSATLVKPITWPLVSVLVITLVGILMIGLWPHPFVTLAREAVAGLL